MQFVIVHGAYGSKDGNWFPWLKKELADLKQDIILEQFPVEDWNDVETTGPAFKATKQTLTKWLQTFESKILNRLNQTEPLCFIGHSLGPQFILHAVSKYDLNLDSAIFVMPFSSLLGKDDWMFNVVNESFMGEDFNYEDLKSRIPASYTIYSDNDIVPANLCLRFADKLGSTPILLKGAKHINAPLFTRLPLVLELCKSRLDPSLYLGK